LESSRKKLTLPKSTFSDYLKNTVTQKNDVRKLMEAAGIPSNLNAYDITDCAEKIQRYYDTIYPEEFGIWAFNHNGQIKPFFKSKPIESCKKIITLVYNKQEQHYYALVGNPGRLFGKNCKYCFSVSYFYYVYKQNNNFYFQCESIYHRDINHRMDCSKKCLGCLRVGLEFPCSLQTTPRMKPENCKSCRKRFLSDSCYEFHQKRCQYSGACRKCKTIYKTRWFYKPKSLIPHTCHMDME
jgi:hypothetical protein